MLALIITTFLSLLSSSLAWPVSFHGIDNLAVRSTSSVEHAIPFTFEPVFTAKLTLGYTTNTTILAPGGSTVVETIASGTVTGSAINATVHGGMAYPDIISQNVTKPIQAPSIDLYGITSDGMDFRVSEVGIGSETAQVTRIQVYVSGSKYQPLVNGYILASVNPQKTTPKSVLVKAFLVTDTASA